MGLFDTTSGGAATGYPGLLNQARRARQIPRPLLESPQQHLDLATGLLGMIPGIGDAVGLAADVNRYKNEPETRTWGNYGLSALGLLPFVPGITVWHGSPHKFDKFDASKIGTGEGAQAYGHGTYLADAKDTAKSYRDALASDVKVRGMKINDVISTPEMPLKPIDKTALQMIQLTNGEKTIDYVNDLIKLGKQPKELRAVTSQWLSDIESVRGGFLYKAELPDEWLPKMIDWDKPLKDQPGLLEKVRAAMHKGPQESYRMDAWVRDSPQASGGDLIKHIERLYGVGYANKAMASSGIPGIRYLDGNSRNAGQGTYNYVVFPGLEDQVKILSRE